MKGGLENSIWYNTIYMCESKGVSHSVVFSSLQPHGLQPARLLCPQNSPGKNTGVGCHSLLQGIFLTQGLNPGHLTLQVNSLPSEPQGMANSLATVTKSHTHTHIQNVVQLRFDSMTEKSPDVIGTIKAPSRGKNPRWGKKSRLVLQQTQQQLSGFLNQQVFMIYKSIGFDLDQEDNTKCQT